MAQHVKAPRVAAIVLAAGASSRMGTAKQLLDLGGRSLVRHAAEVAHASGCSPVIVVVGARAEAVRAELLGLAARIVHNAEWQEGLASSLRSGVRSLPADAAAAILMPCDQPAISPDLLERLIRRWRETSAPIVACGYDGIKGAPALFTRERFGQLLALEGDVGARALLAQGADAVETVEFPDGRFDLDTPEDWESWRARSDA